MGHWYTKEGEPMHFIVGANGKERDTTLRDARKLQLRPSVTEVNNILDKPGLNAWMLNQLLYAALTTPRPEGISDDEFLKIVRLSAAEEAEQAKLRGNEIHECLESIVKWNESVLDEHSSEVVKIAFGALHIVEEYCQTDNFTPEKTVAGDGYGGMIDLHNDDFVIDYKTKDITDKQWDDYEAGKNPRLAYPEMACQLAAYDAALCQMKQQSLGTSFRRCINVFIDRQIPGRVIIHEWKPEEIEHAWREFSACLKLWQLKKHYVPE